MTFEKVIDMKTIINFVPIIYQE
jgi:hypothetical protein